MHNNNFNDGKHLHLTSSSIPKIEMCVQIFYHFSCANFEEALTANYRGILFPENPKVK